jgi:hypothetical protein
VDVGDLVPAAKLRLPLSAAAGDPPQRPRGGGGNAGPAFFPPPSRGDELLWVAALNGRVAVLEGLLAAKGLLKRGDPSPSRVPGGEGVDEKNALGRSPLFCAAERGHAEAVAVLLAHGAHPDNPDGAHRRPLLAAAEGGFAHVCALLLAAGAERDWRVFPDGETALAAAERLGHQDVARLLRAA